MTGPLNKKGLVILGSTGSIGRQTLDIVRAFPDQFDVVGLGAGYNLDLLQKQVAEFSPRLVYCADDAGNLDTPTEVAVAPMEEMVCHPDVSTVMVGTTGPAGLLPTLEALRAGRTVCLANK